MPFYDAGVSPSYLIPLSSSGLTEHWALHYLKMWQWVILIWVILKLWWLNDEWWMVKDERTEWVEHENEDTMHLITCNLILYQEVARHTTILCCHLCNQCMTSKFLGSTVLSFFNRLRTPLELNIQKTHGNIWFDWCCHFR